MEMEGVTETMTHMTHGRYIDTTCTSFMAFAFSHEKINVWQQQCFNLRSLQQFPRFPGEIPPTLRPVFEHLNQVYLW